MLRLYNTLNHKIEDIKPINPSNVGFYSCGPTVYDFAHIGHARTYIFSDILERVLKFNGFKVKRVMNITDVGHLTSDSDSGEDKMELASRRSGKGAKREGKTVWDIAKFYTDDFMLMLTKLNIQIPQIICKATDFIGSMVKTIELLEKKGFTYQIEDGIYFDTSKFPKYGKLTGQNFIKLQKSLKGGARVEMTTGKKHPTDFAMWKFSPSASSRLPKRQMEWDSPWGVGFPGWHIECSAMAMEHLGETIDIHTGGVDHIPIHHTNEIAQSEAATGKQFVRYWLHADHLLVDGEKMSKSLGNFYRLNDIEEKGYSPLALRYLFLTSSYKTAMNFTWKSLEGAQSALNGLRAQISNFPASPAGRQFPISKKERTNLSEEKLKKIYDFRNRFTEAVNDDLNTAQALGIVWEAVKSNIPGWDKYDLVIAFDEVLGLGLNQITDNRQQITIPDDIKKLADKRERLRKDKKFEEADEIRKKIEGNGYSLQDISGGPIIVPK